MDSDEFFYNRQPNISNLRRTIDSTEHHPKNNQNGQNDCVHAPFIWRTAQKASHESYILNKVNTYSNKVSRAPSLK